MEPVAEVFERWAARTHAPALAWGVVRDGSLAEHGGVGRDAPGVATVFRIASMTKSFTGAALMSLVAEGRVRLDDPVAEHVPALGAWRGPTTDGPPLTIRHLVSMEAGLPTDDPWADRHMDITPAGMDDLMDAGATFAWPPGVSFEYSNLGWGLVGRVIQAVAGRTPQEVVTERLLVPLGMTATTWTRPTSTTTPVAEPFRWQDGRHVAEPEPVGDGQIAPMGGLWSTVGDLARWVAFHLDAWPPRDDPDEGPTPRWARREQAQLRRFDELTVVRPRPGGPSRTVAIGYGIGLGIRVDPKLGTVVGHSGGLPGYGSHMRWIAERGLGVIALANTTYANMHAACIEALEVLADLDALGHRRPLAAPALDRAAADAAALLHDWEDARADALFADNVAPDEPYERRAAQARGLRSRHGDLAVETLTPDTPLRGTFTAAGGLVKADLGLDHTGKVQWLDVTDRTEPSEEPIVLDPHHLVEAAGTAYVVVRPSADLADAFIGWQGEVLDRLGGGRVSVPAPHATLKTFGSSDAPLTPADAARIGEVVETWASQAPPLELRAEALGAFDEDDLHIPMVRLDTTALREAMRELWSRAEAAGLPPGYGDTFGVDGWIAHLSLVYPREVDPGRWAEVVTWLRGVTTAASCIVATADLVVFEGGPERIAGRWPLAGVAGANVRP